MDGSLIHTWFYVCGVGRGRQVPAGRISWEEVINHAGLPPAESRFSNGLPTHSGPARPSQAIENMNTKTRGREV